MLVLVVGACGGSGEGTDDVAGADPPAEGAAEPAREPLDLEQFNATAIRLEPALITPAELEPLAMSFEQVQREALPETSSVDYDVSGTRVETYAFCDRANSGAESRVNVERQFTRPDDGSASTTSAGLVVSKVYLFASADEATAEMANERSLADDCDVGRTFDAEPAADETARTITLGEFRVTDIADLGDDAHLREYRRDLLLDKTNGTNLDIQVNSRVLYVRLDDVIIQIEINLGTASISPLDDVLDPVPLARSAVERYAESGAV